MNEESKYDKDLLLREAATYRVLRAPQNFLSDTLEVFVYMRDMRVMQDPVFRESMSEPQHSSKEKPNAA